MTIRKNTGRGGGAANERLVQRCIAEETRKHGAFLDSEVDSDALAKSAGGNPTESATKSD